MDLGRLSRCWKRSGSDEYITTGVENGRVFCVLVQFWFSFSAFIVIFVYFYFSSNFVLVQFLSSSVLV